MKKLAAVNYEDCVVYVDLVAALRALRGPCSGRRRVSSFLLLGVLQRVRRRQTDRIAGPRGLHKWASPGATGADLRDPVPRLPVLGVHPNGRPDRAYFA
jgi:hypothetical protein